MSPDVKNLMTGYTLLHYAACYGNLENIEILLSYKADYNALSNRQASPLSIAVEQGKAQIVLMLLQVGSNPNQIDSG